MNASPTISMSRRVAFSSGHRYWLNHLSEDENLRRFGENASRYSHGHNYVLEGKVSGKVDPVTGMIVNIKRIDDILQERIVNVYDKKSLNDEVEAFSQVAPCIENILLDCHRRLRDLPSEVRLTELKLEEMPTLWGELLIESNMITLTQTFEFAASHRLNVPSLSHDENIELFGKCNNEAGHGHNYLLEVTVSGDPNPETGMIVDLGQLIEVVEERIVNRYDHKNLSEDIPEFSGKCATSEVVVQEIWNRLVGDVPGRLERVRLHETARNIFEASRS